MPPVFPLPVGPPHASSSVRFLRCTSVLINPVLKTLVSPFLFTPHHLGALGRPCSGTSSLCPYRPTLWVTVLRSPCALSAHTLPRLPATWDVHLLFPWPTPVLLPGMTLASPVLPHPRIRHSSPPVLVALCTFLPTSLHWALIS